MPTLTVTKSYSDGAALTEAQLDAAKDSIETFVNTTKLDEDNIQDAAVTTAKLDTGAVTTSKIAADAVTSAKLSSSASVDADRAVGTNHIKDGAVTADKIAANAVTLAKRSGANYAQSASCGTFTLNSASLTAVTNLSVSLTPSGTGQVIYVVLIPTSSGAYFSYDSSGSSCYVSLYSGSTELVRSSVNTGYAATKLPITLAGIEVSPSSSAITYTCKISPADTNTATLANYTLLAFEIW